MRRPSVGRVRGERTRPWHWHQRHALRVVWEHTRVLSVRRHLPRASSAVQEDTHSHHQQHAQHAVLEPIRWLLLRRRAHGVCQDII